MKNNYLFLFCLLSISLFSCTEDDKKEDSGPKLSPQETILTSHKWNEVSHVVTNSKGEVIADNRFTDACQQDDVTTFKKDGTWSYDPGVPCRTSNIPHGGTWKLIGTKLSSTQSPSPTVFEAEMKKITDTEFISSSEFNGTTQVHTFRAL